MIEQGAETYFFKDRIDYKLREADFFYNKMIATHTRPELDYYFHACLSAAYSTFCYLKDECALKNKLDLFNKIKSEEIVKFFIEYGSARGKDAHEIPTLLVKNWTVGPEDTIDKNENSYVVALKNEKVELFLKQDRKFEIKSNFKKLITVLREASEILKSE